MIIKRITAGILVLAVLGLNAFAFTPYLPEQQQDTQQETQESNDKESVEDTDSNVPDQDDSSKEPTLQYVPKNYYYNVFKQIMDTYVEEHLYDFTHEELMYKFFEDFLTDNPVYFKFFVNYMLSTMDPYSGYYEVDSGFLKVEDSSIGFGFTVEQKDEGVYISSVIDNSNAHTSGLMTGDKFISVCGIDTTNLPIDAVMIILQSPQLFWDVQQKEEQQNNESTPENIPQTEKEFPITIERNGETITFNISKGPFTPPQVTTHIDNNNGKPTAYIAVSSFLGDGTDTQFVSLVEKYAEDGIKNLTIDLRNNGGGSLEYALSMAECFIPKDDIICYYNEKSLEKPTPIYSTTDYVTFDSITVLINEHSASAAELFTNILKTKGLAKVVGTTSYGKNLGQTVYVLGNGDYITITTYEILDENFNTYGNTGIVPDLLIEDVEMCYTLPKLAYFNHENYVEIKEGQYSEVTKALEDRLVILGLLYEKYADGVFDDLTKSALLILQKNRKIEATGYVTNDTVTKITELINSYKEYTYFDNAQYEVAMIVHYSFSQGKRLVSEKERLRTEQKQLIQDRNLALEAEYDASFEQ